MPPFSLRRCTVGKHSFPKSSSEPSSSAKTVAEKLSERDQRKLPQPSPNVRDSFQKSHDYDDGTIIKRLEFLWVQWKRPKYRNSVAWKCNLCRFHFHELGDETEKQQTMSRIHCCMYSVRSKRHNKDKSPSPKASLKHKNLDNALSHIPSLSRNGSPRSSSPTPALVQKSMSRKSSELSTNGFPASLSRSVSRRSTTPIMFSNSSGMLKPPPIQKDLDCTLEELCYGCTKKVKVTRDVLTNTGQIAEEEEVLKIKVKPGWTKGTTISFEGMGNETLGCFPADINFVIAEKRHSLFRRDGDDLEIVVEIPLLKALTGCEISVPLLGGEEMSLRIDDVIYPGYQEVIEGQGMPSTKEQGKRGDLKVVFLVEFPAQLTDEQRSVIFSILAEDSC